MTWQQRQKLDESAIFESSPQFTNFIYLPVKKKYTLSYSPVKEMT